MENHVNINIQLPKFNLTAPNLPYVNGKGHYLLALIALVQDRVGDKSFYAGMKEMIPLISLQDDANRGEQISDVLEDEGAQNLDLMLSVMEEKDKLKQDVVTLGNAFIEDFQERITQVDTQYLTVTNTEPAVSATPKLASLLHTYFSVQPLQTRVPGTRCMHVQPTAISR